MGSVKAASDSALSELKERQNRSKAVKAAAFKAGILCKDKPEADALEGVALPKSIRESGGRDIMSKMRRANDFLVLFPFTIDFSASSKFRKEAFDFAEIVQLDTKNPIMYIPFEQGRLKVTGTLVHPRNKYFGIKIPKGAVAPHMFAGVYEHILVFSEYFWVGTKEENPEEDPMELPEGLAQVIQVSDIAAKADPEEEVMDEDEEEESGEETPPLKRMPKRSSKSRAEINYNENEEEEDLEEEESDE